MRLSRLLLAAGLAVVVGGAASQARLDLDPQALEQTYATGPSQFIEAAGIRFHVRDRGTGPAIVLIHGQSANLFSFEAWAERLALDYRVISVDLPGHGLTGPDPQARYSWAGMAEAIGALTDVMELDDYLLVGNSLGGAVSLELALQRQHDLRGLVLIDAIGFPRVGPKPMIFEAYSWPVVGEALTVFTPEWVVRSSLEDTFGDASKVTDAEAKRFYDLMLRRGNRAAGKVIVAQPQDDHIARRLKELTLPVLVLWGEADTWTPPQYGLWFAQSLPGAGFVTFPELGHMPMAEDPDATLGALRDWMAKSDV